MNKLFVEGIITKLSTSSSTYCHISAKAEMYFFNKSTKIGGCKYDQLEVGDRVLIKKVNRNTMVSKQVPFVSLMDIVDIEKKWNSILNKDTKYSTINLSTIEDKDKEIIKPERIEKDTRGGVINYDALEEYLRVTKFKNEKEQKVMQLLWEGLSVRQIGNLLNIPKSNCFYYIKKHLSKV